MTGHAELVIRQATKADMPVLGRLGASLMHVHHAFDDKRFLAPGDDAAAGYAWFLGTQLMEAEVVIFVAERDGRVIGYVYAGVEPLSWKELRDECGFIHDVLVEEGSRGGGVAAALVEAACAWLRERGMPRVVLGTAYQNDRAMRLFGRLGFRPTMVEMTREL